MSNQCKPTIDLIERLRLGDGTSADHELLLEAADALEALAQPEHDLYTDADKDKPDAICDRNGQVALAMCKKCGKAEIELDAPCVKPQPEQDEPVAVVTGVYGGRFIVEPTNSAMVLPVNMALYAHPPQRTWVDLTIEQIVDLVRNYQDVPATLVGETEAKLRKLNEAPQRKPLRVEQYIEIGQRHWLPSIKVEQIHKEIEEAAHGIKE